MSEQASKNELSIQLPWTVPQPPLYSTHIAVDPETHKIPLDLNVSSTDWMAVGAIFISFLAFLVTIYVTRKSTESQMKSNLSLITSQNDLKMKELKVIQRSKELEELRRSIQNYISCGVAVQHFYELSHSYSSYGNSVKEEKTYFKQQLATNKINFRIATYSLFTYFDLLNETHQKIHLSMLDLMSNVFSMIENEENIQKYEENMKEYIEKFQFIHATLKTLLQLEYENNKGE